jgi:hypothetical protein
MRLAPLAQFASLGLASVFLTACGGSSAPPVGQTQAAAACKTGGASAAQLAGQAAALNPIYATLSADENVLAGSEAGQVNELSDGDPTDDSGLGDLAGADATGSGADVKVLTDCTTLGLSVSH